jgi:ribonuclease D
MPKKMTKPELDHTAKSVKDLWLCRYGEKNAKKLSLAVRRLFKEKKINAAAIQQPKSNSYC